jgi:protein-S-isoprenylcysteine O-methyltransferase Ste14
MPAEVSSGPGPQRRSPWARRLSQLQDALLIVVSALFLYAHARNVAGGHLASIGFAAESALQVGIFLVRRRPMAVSRRPLDWLFAAGAWLPLLSRPDEGQALPAAIGLGVQLCGLGLACIGFMYLGRSFGVVAANRGVKVSGPYRLVRHPIYVAHAVTLGGFVLANPTAWNLAILLATSVCQLFRIHAEERVLRQSEQYREYATRVRWRLLPGVF